MARKYKSNNLPNIRFEFFQSAISALVENMTALFRSYNLQIPVYIFNTGDQIMTDEWKDATATEIPRLVLSLEDIAVSADNLTSPYQRGEFVVTNTSGADEQWSAQLRRIPLKLNVSCTLTVSNVIEMFKWQEVILLLMFKQNIVEFQYYKKLNQGAYQLPDSISYEKNLEFGFDDTRRNRTISFTIEYDIQYPAFDFANGSLMRGNNVIKEFPSNVIPSDSVSSNVRTGKLVSSVAAKSPNIGKRNPETGDNLSELADELLENELLPRDRGPKDYAEVKQPTVTNSWEPMPGKNHHSPDEIDRYLRKK